ncbi:Uncharacterised protein [Vibrio cholerae]|nr:Uncharacterised protein [Vibrio cholerae]
MTPLSHQSPHHWRKSPTHIQSGFFQPHER